MAKAKFNLKAALKGADKVWKTKAKAEAQKGGFEEYEDGSYVARLLKIEIGPTANNPRKLMAILSWKFLEGDVAGKKHKSFRPLTDDKGVFDDKSLANFVKYEIRRLGYSVDDLDALSEDLPTIFDEINEEKPVCRIILKSSGEYQNTNIKKVLDEDEVEDESEDADDEDEKPKKKSKSKSKSKSKNDEDEDAEDEDEDEDGGDDDEDADDEDEDEDDEDEKPKKGKKAKSKSKAKNDDDDDEDADEDADDEDADEDGDEDEDGEEDGDDDAGVAVSVGSNVKVKTKDGIVKAEILEIFEDDEKVKVKTAKGKTVTLPADRITAVLDPPPAPKKKAGAKKPVKKTRK